MTTHQFVAVPSTFPAANRPIYVADIARVTHKNKEEAYPALALALNHLQDLHPDDNILVHTVSYDMNSYLYDALEGRRKMTYRRAADRETALAKFVAGNRAVLLAPSFERGVNLPDDACRVVVVAKVPFPYLGDKQVNARYHSRGGSRWYMVQTVRSLVQSTGRGVRHENDYAVSYILDRMFRDSIWKEWRSLLPRWWKDALNWGFDTRKLRAPRQ